MAVLELKRMGESIPLTNHLATDAVAGPCSNCGRYAGHPPPDRAHLVDLVIYCGACCPVCGKDKCMCEQEN